jgi:predicted permease
LIFASLVSLDLFFAPFSLPDSLWGAISTIGGLMTPLALLSIGFWIAEIPIRQIFMNPRSYIVALLKLMIFPLAMLFITRQMGVTPLVSNVLTIIAAIPSATLNVVFAKRYHCGDEFAVQTVVLTNVLMMITLPLLLILIL